MLRADAWAGVSVGLVLIPQALAYATLAGMPPASGLYAALLPGVVGALWGSSPLLAAGPVALTSLLTYGALQPFASPGSAHWVALAVWLALYAGLIQLALGVARLGILANFVSQPVVAGFVNAAALIIIGAQLPALLGLPADLDGEWLARALAHWQAAPELTLATAGFGLTACGLLLALRRWLPRHPGVLYACVLGIAASALLGYAPAGGAVVGAVPGGLPSPAWPSAIGFAEHRALLPAALIVALVSFTEAMSSARTLARKRGERWDENQELIGQGMAKLASGACGAFPVSGSFSRSALNLYAGARSAWSGVFASLCVAACLLWFTELLAPLPRAVLAATIVVPVLGLIDLGVFRRLWRYSRDDGAVAAVTFAGTLLAVPYLHWGVFVGFFASTVCYLYRRAHPRLLEVAEHPPSGTLRDRAHYELPPLAPGVLAVRIDASINYVTAPLLERFILDRLRPELRTVLITATAVNDLDATGIETLRGLRRLLVGHGAELHLTGLKRHVWERLERAGLPEEWGGEAFSRTEREAIERLRAQGARHRA